MLNAFLDRHRLHDRPFPWRTLIRHELPWALVTGAVSLVVMISIVALGLRRGWIDTGPAPWTRIALEFSIYFVLFDFFFYVVHRLLHRDRFYRLIHYVHHVSVKPTPLAGFSFSPFETAITASFNPLLAVALHFHVTTIIAAAAFGFATSLIYHAGLRLFPRWWHRTWLTGWFLTPFFHDQHHQYRNYNFGGFTTVWDRVFGTARPGFIEDHARHGL